jgi:DNA-binding NarL/FixJ family response regulator
MRCLVVDDHPLTRDGTALALRSGVPGMQVLEAGSLEQAFSVLGSAPDVALVLLDLGLADSRGVDTLRTLKAWMELHAIDARVVVLSGDCDAELVREVIEHHATGFILKATSTAIFVNAVLLTLAGGVYIPEIAVRQIGPPAAPAPSIDNDTCGLGLTPRETQVAALLVQGHTYKRIARELEGQDGQSISDHTVRVHVGRIAWKLGVTENVKAGVMAEIARRRLTFPLPR